MTSDSGYSNNYLQFPESRMSPCLSKGNSRIAAITFFAKTHANDVCGLNGLPLTQNSICILGKSQYLKDLSHPNLTEYLDILRGKHGKMIK